jgi:excisionase family DNA binding protein
MAQLLTINDFMERYSISRTQVYRLVNQGKIPLLKMGTASRIRREDAEAWAASLPTYQGEAA